jgi:hypothetical protein
MILLLIKLLWEGTKKKVARAKRLWTLGHTRNTNQRRENFPCLEGTTKITGPSLSIEEFHQLAGDEDVADRHQLAGNS